MSYKIEITPRTLHFKQPAGTSRGVYTTRKSYFLSITSSLMPDRKGFGECATLPDLSCDAVPDYEELLRRCCDEVERSGEIDVERLRDFPSILFGLETAWLHLHNGNRLFDTPFSRGEEGIPINGLVWMGSFDEMYSRLREKFDAGFRCVKLKIGAIDWQQELSLIRFIRQHFSTEQVELRVDANGAFADDEAMERLEQLAQYGIHSIEQPVAPYYRRGERAEVRGERIVMRDEQQEKSILSPLTSDLSPLLQTMATLCRNTPIPIALDEELIGINEPELKEAMLDAIRPQYIILKPSLHGGMSGTREWIEMARRRGIGSWITSALESNVGLNAIAQLAADIYGPRITLPQGLGTGQLFTDNIPMPLEIRGDRLYCTPST